MLGGLEISEIMLSGIQSHTKSFRTDAEFFKKEYLNQDKAIAKNGFDKLVNLTTKINVGFVGQMVEHYQNEGIALLQTKNIDAFFINDNNLIKITEKFHKQLAKSQIKKKDILIARSGSFGKASIYLEDITINTSDIIIVEANALKINPYFLVSYLNSKFGVGQMIRFSSGGLQGHVNLTILEELEVPKIIHIFQEKIEKIIVDAYKKRQDSQNLYTLAEQILLFEIGLLGNHSAGYTEENLGDWVSDDPSEQMLANVEPGPREEFELLRTEFEQIMAEQDRLKAIVDYDGEIAHWTKNRDYLQELADEIAKKQTQLKFIENNRNLYHLEMASSKNTNIKSFSESFGTTGRLDAEYYQQKYEQVIERIISQKHDLLKNMVEISKSIEPGSSHYSEDTGLPFYRVSDFNKFGLSKPSKELTDAFVNDNKALIEKIKPKRGTIFFSKDGSVGTAYLLREDLDGITSGAILHLKVKNTKEIIPAYLTLALNSKLVQMQAERDAGGSIILHWRKEEIEQVVVPVIDYKLQEKIATLIEESFQLKSESEGLLAVAKRAVEIAIEEDEAAAMRYIAANK